jgi:hypothetical protein
MPKHRQFAFDLISDLYVDDWEPAQWAGQPTSLLAVIAGDISKDLDRTVYELQCISQQYRQVMYIDGDLEHSEDLNAVSSNRKYLCKKLSKIQNLTYMHEQVMIINDVAFVAANLWWTPGETNSSINDQNWIDDMKMLTLHHEDLDYLRYTVQRMQKSNDVNNVVVVSHTVPNRQLLLNYDEENIATDASEYLDSEDINNKISTWCFGHWNHALNITVNQCDFVSNPKGRPELSSGLLYHPLRVVV